MSDVVPLRGTTSLTASSALYCKLLPACAQVCTTLQIMTTTLIPRESYLRQLITWDAEPALIGVVRIITGVRRCGKSSLLRLYAEHVGAENVLAVNFEDYATSPLREPDVFLAHIAERRKAKGFTHLHIDEVQELREWARVVNSLRLDERLTITLTGSNASMFAGEGLTFLAGRYVELPMLPLSLREYNEFNPSPGSLEERYSTWMHGTLPAVARVQDAVARQTLNTAMFDSVFTRDISLRGEVRDTSVLLRVARFVFDNVGSPLSVNKVANTLTSAGLKTSNHTVERYLQLMLDAHMFYPCRPFDIRGREHLNSGTKYYFVDPGLRDALLGSRNTNTGHDIENMVYLELRRRGYNVTSGRIGAREIDFIANGEQFIQVALTALNPDILTRELRAFEGLPVGAPCTLLTLDRVPLPTGHITHINALDFLAGAPLTRARQ